MIHPYFSEGPLRCTRCHAYVSSHANFPTDSTMICNFCGHVFDLSKYYQQYLGYSSKRTNLCDDYTTGSVGLDNSSEVNELSRGMVDYVATDSFLTNTQKEAYKTYLRPQNLPHMKSNTQHSYESCVIPPAVCFVVDTSTSARTNGTMMQNRHAMIIFIT